MCQCRSHHYVCFAGVDGTAFMYHRPSLLGVALLGVGTLTDIPAVSLASSAAADVIAVSNEVMVRHGYHRSERHGVSAVVTHDFIQDMRE